MNRILLTIVLCACSLWLRAQLGAKDIIFDGQKEMPNFAVTDYEYQPFIMDGSCEWIISTGYGLNGYKVMISNEDTLILDKIYKKVFISQCKQPDLREYNGAIREDNKCVFFVSNVDIYGQINHSERKIYDFNLKKGDEMVYESHDLGTLRLEVARIDTIEMEGINRRVFHFEGGLPFGYDSWTEGIGSKYVFTCPFPALVIGYNPILAGVWHNGEALFCDGYKCSCDEILPIVEHASAPDFRILQNPVKNKLLSIAFNEAIFSKLDLYSFDGQLQSTKEFDAKVATIEIPLAGFQAGNYILILTRKDGSRESCKVIVL